MQAPAVSRLRSSGPFGQDERYVAIVVGASGLSTDTADGGPFFERLSTCSPQGPGEEARYPVPSPGGHTKTPEGTNRCAGPWPPVQAPASRFRRATVRSPHR
jgi:hypothetical protein